MPNRGLSPAIGLGAVLLSAACAPKPAVETAMASEGTRRDSFEATLQVLDENPAYVDELYAATLRHPDTLDRFVQNMARGLTNEQLAQATAKRLAEQPDSLKTMMRALVQQAQKDETARRALLEAIQQNGEPLAGMIVSDPKVLNSLLKAFAKVGVDKGQDKLDALIEALGGSE